MNILTGLEAVKKIIHECILLENTPEGVLSDVNEVILVAVNEYGISEPCVWINQHPTIVAPGKTSTLSNDLMLQTSFEFVCIAYDPDQLEAEMKSQNLASRCVLAVLKNFSKVQKKYGERVIHNIKFNMFYPVGDVNIMGKSDGVPATSVVLDIQHYVTWLNCCNKKKKERKG